MRPLRVFLCHASQDKPVVRELFNALKAEDWIDSWLDKAKILPGQDWEMVIEKAVDASDVVIACLSNQSVSKEGFIQREIRYAYDLALEKPEETIFLIPLRLEDCIVPRKLKSLHWVDYFGADKDEAYSNLLEALKLRYDQKLKAEELEREKQEQKRQEAEELSRQLAEEKAAREKAELEAKAEREARLKWERERVVGRVSNPTDPVAPKKRQAKSLTYGFWGIGLLALLLVGIGLNSLLGNSPTPTEPPAPTPADTPVVTEPPVIKKPPTFTGTPTATELPTATETSSLGIGSTMTGSGGMTLLYVPAGEFTMGSDSGDSDEKPVHTVYLDAFWIDETEVTNAMYKKCVDAGGCKPPTRLIYFNNSSYTDHPVVYVDYNQATGYCKWAGRRLPTEAEWEKAASWDEDNQTKRAYPWGNNIDCSLANYYGKDNGNSGCTDDTVAVKTYENGKSFYGAYGMAGNVWEWVNDRYYDGKYYEVSPSSNPPGPDSGDTFVLRGGSLSYVDFNVRSTVRLWNYPTSASRGIGFRCARSP